MAPAASGILVVVVTALPYTLANFQRGHLTLALIDGASSGAMLLGYRVGELRTDSADRVVTSSAAPR